MWRWLEFPPPRLAQLTALSHHCVQHVNGRAGIQDYCCPEDWRRHPFRPSDLVVGAKPENSNNNKPPSLPKEEGYRTSLHLSPPQKKEGISDITYVRLVVVSLLLLLLLKLSWLHQSSKTRIKEYLFSTVLLDGEKKRKEKDNHVQERRIKSKCSIALVPTNKYGLGLHLDLYHRHGTRIPFIPTQR